MKFKVKKELSQTYGGVFEKFSDNTRCIIDVLNEDTDDIVELDCLVHPNDYNYINIRIECRNMYGREMSYVMTAINNKEER